jgi:hypothetical protein
MKKFEKPTVVKMGEIVREIKEYKITATTLIWAIGLTIILTASINFLIYFLPSVAACNQNVGDLIPTPGVDLLGIPFMMILVTAVLMRIPSARKHLTNETLVFLYVVALASSAFANQDSPWRESGEPLWAKIGTSPDITRYLPDFVSPPRETANILVAGTGSIGAIPWAAFFPAMIWRFLSFAFFVGISVGIASIFRRQWMDVEMLPYPQVMLANSAIVGARDVGIRSWAGRIPFIVGLIAGLAIEMIRMLSAFYPWFPDIFAFRTQTCGPGAQQIQWGGVPWNMNLAKHTPLYTLLFLVPLHSLWSMVFYGLVYEIAGTAAFYLGYYTGYTNMGECGRSWCAPVPYSDPPLNFGSLITGVFMGVFVMTVYLERRHIVKTLRMAFGSAKDEAYAAREAMSYRAAYIITIVSSVLMIALFMSAGMSFYVSFVVTITGIITWFTASQLFGRIGFSNEPGYCFGPGFAKMLIWPSAYRLPVTSTDTILGPNLTYELASHRPSVPWATTFYTTLGTYKMSSLMEVHPRSMIIIAAITLTVAAFVGVIMNIWIPGVYGMNITTMRGSLDFTSRYNTFWDKPSPHPMTEIAPWITTGFVFVVVVKLLQARFLWIPDPIMAIVAWDWVGSLHGTWMAAFIVAILKWLVLRIGGSKLYSERVVPFVGGFILGDALNAIVAGTLALTVFRPA